MSTYYEEYETLKEQFHEKIAPLYEKFPWDDPFNDTILGSRELDCVVANVLYNASPEDVEIIYAYIESISVQRNIPVNVSDSIEETEKLWMEKAEAAKVILERTDSFVEVILAYYNKMEGQK